MISNGRKITKKVSSGFIAALSIIWYNQKVETAVKQAVLLMTCEDAEAAQAQAYKLGLEIMRNLSLDAFTLRVIAIISMTLSHIVLILWEALPMWLVIPLYALRGITFPVMAFFVTEGFKYTSNIKKYMLRLLIFGIIAQIPYMLAFGFGALNIIFAFLLGLCCLALYDRWYVKAQKRARFVIVFILILLIPGFFVEGQFVGLLLIFLFYVIKDERQRRTIPLAAFGGFVILLTLISFWTVNSDMIDTATGIAANSAMRLTMLMTQMNVFVVGTFLIIPFLLAYNGERGRKAKYLFYAFYPAHLAILAAIAFALQLNDLPMLPF